MDYTMNYKQQDLNTVHNLLISNGFTLFEVIDGNSFNTYTKENMIVTFFKYNVGMLSVFRKSGLRGSERIRDYLPNEYMKLTNDKDLAKLFRDSKINSLIYS